MIVKIKKTANKEDVQELLSHLKKYGFEIHSSFGEKYEVYGVIGDTSTFDTRSLFAYPCVDNVIRIQEPFKKVNRKIKKEDTIVNVNGVMIGGNNLTIMAGPCSIESEEQLDTIAKSIKSSGAVILRGGAYKPRTSPYAFQGLGEEGLILLEKIGKKYGMPVISEITNILDIDLFVKYVDIIQVGARNMQNFALLKALSLTNKPIMLKRGFSNTIEEWLMSAEYLMQNDNPNIILCERGIRTFEKYTRNTLDISTVPIVKKMSHLPVIIDPSHAAGKWDLVESLSMGSVASGADGLMVEVHHEPENALSDGAQSLKPPKFDDMMKKISQLANLIGKKM